MAILMLNRTFSLTICQMWQRNLCLINMLHCSIKFLGHNYERFSMIFNLDGNIQSKTYIQIPKNIVGAFKCKIYYNCSK